MIAIINKYITTDQIYFGETPNIFSENFHFIYSIFKRIYNLLEFYAFPPFLLKLHLHPTVQYCCQNVDIVVIVVKILNIVQ
jgi:hypothetical protein